MKLGVKSFLLGVFFFSCAVYAQPTFYVRSGAAGANNGADWSNAFGSLPSTLQRGATYYVADGNYPSYTFDDALSGTQYIYVKKATEQNHGTSTGWNAAYGDGQAVFGILKFTAGGYFSIDGQQKYGIKVAFSQNGVQGINFTSGGVNSILRYIEVAGPGGDGDYFYQSGTTGISAWGGQADNLLIQYCNVYGCDTLIDASSNGLIVEHSDFHGSRSINSAVHSNIYYLSGGGRNITFRYNRCYNYHDEGILITGWSGTPSDVYIYGNVFSSPGTIHPRGIEIRQDYSFSNIFIFNNTFANLSVGGILNRTGETGHRTTGCQARNNIGLNAGFSFGDFAVNDNNSSVSSTVFVDPANANFRLRTAVPGVALTGANFGVDMDNIRRGVDGTWDRGAYEFNSGIASAAISLTPSSLDFGIVPPASSKDLTLTIQNTGNATLSGSASANAPFSILSGGTYNLSPGASQTVTLRYSPATAGNHSGQAVFSGAGTVTAALSGVSQQAASGSRILAPSGSIAAPFAVSQDYVSQSVETGLNEGGRAVYNFSVATSGVYRVQLVVNAPNEGANSLFLEIDRQPTDPDSIWDIPLTAGFEPRNAGARGTGSFDSPQFPERLFSLSAGNHTLTLVGREGGVQFSEIFISPVTGHSPPRAPQGVSISTGP